VFQHASMALVTSAGVAVSLIVTSIIITRSLGVTGRGEVAASVLIPTVVSYMGQLGLPTAVGYWVNTDPDNRETTIGTGRTLSLLISGILMVITWILISVLPLDPQVRAPALLFVLYIPFNIIPPVDSAVLQADMRAKALNGVRLVSATTYLLLVLTFVALGWASTYTILIAQLVSVVVWLILASNLARTFRLFRYRSDIARRLLSYGIRSHLGAVQPVDTLKVDQMILGLFLSPHALGTYVVAMTFVTANRMIGLSVGLVAFPVASRVSVDRYKHLKYLFAIGSMIVFVAAIAEIAFGRRLLQMLFDVHEDEAYIVMSVLVIGSVFMVMRQVLSDIVRGFGFPGIATLSEVVLFVTVVVLALGLWQHELVGVAWAVAVSSCIAFFFMLCLAWDIRAKN
jgi:O-antigen/teichoic acid export membrane protein